MANIGSYPLNEIITGDSRLLAQSIPDESIDLVFTDPVYENIQDYIWLAEVSKRVLVSGGNLVAFVSPDKQLEIGNLFVNSGFTWCDNLILRETARRRFNHGRKIVGLYEVAVWVSKGSARIGKYVNNFSFVSNGYIKSDKHHDWQKEVKGITHWIERLSVDVVADFFAGGGSIPAACVSVGRSFIASEINQKNVDIARRHVLATQPPLGLAKPNTASSRLFEGWGDLPAVANQSESDLPV